MRPSTPIRILASALVATVALVVVAAGCSSSNGAPDEEPAIAATVHIVDGAFDPRDIEIEPGGVVMWINDDVTTHSLTFLDVDIRSGGIRPDRSWIHTFDVEGEFPYYDDIRNTMKGTVVVRPAP